MQNAFCSPLAGRHRRVNTIYCLVTLLPLACEVSGIVPASKVFEIPPAGRVFFFYRNTTIKCHLRAHASSIGDLDFWTRRQSPNRNSQDYPWGNKSSPHYIVRCNAYLGCDKWVYTAILAVSLSREILNHVGKYYYFDRQFEREEVVSDLRIPVSKKTRLFGKKNVWQLNSCRIPTDFILHCAVTTITKLD